MGSELLVRRRQVAVLLLVPALSSALPALALRCGASSGVRDGPPLRTARIPSAKLPPTTTTSEQQDQQHDQGSWLGMLVASGRVGGRPGTGSCLTWPCPPSPNTVRQGAPVARVVVDVMLKPEILDPQGKAVHGALPRLGFDGVIDVRQGKRFELEVEGEVTEERLAEVRRAAETLLSNPVIEDYTGRRWKKLP